MTAFDPDPQWPPAANLYAHVRFVRPDGAIVAGPFNAANGTVDPGDCRFFDFDAALCYPTGSTTLDGAFLLVDAAGQQSNTACVSVANGTGP